MGQRANLVVLDHAGWVLHYDHWVANALDAVLIWGPEHTEDFIRRQARTDTWLEENWCEGAVLLDKLRQEVVWFGGNEDLVFDASELDVFLRLMSVTWEGWTVVWATEGLGEIVDRLDVPRSHVRWAERDRREPEMRVRGDLGGALLVTAAEGTMHWSVSTQADVREAVTRGPDWLTTFAVQQAVIEPRMLEYVPSAGVHIDLEEMTLHWWLGHPAMDVASTIATRFPDWRHQGYGRDWRPHAELTSGWIEWPILDEEQIAQRRVRGLWTSSNRRFTNPAAGIVGALNADAAHRGDTSSAFVASADTDLHVDVGVPASRRLVLLATALQRCGWSMPTL